MNTTGRFTLRPAHPGHAPSLSAPGRPARSLGFRLSCRCFVSDEYSRPTEQVVLGPALEVSLVSQFPASATLALRPGRRRSFRRRAQAARLGAAAGLIHWDRSKEGSARPEPSLGLEASLAFSQSTSDIFLGVLLGLRFLRSPSVSTHTL